MSDNETTNRYGNEVDEYSATLIDRLEEAFEDVDGWEIADAANVSIKRNRNFVMEEVTNFTNDGKIHSGVYQAIHDAGFRVTGTYIGVEGKNTCRVWITER